MVNRDAIRKIKQATVAVGLAEKGTLKLISILGSGFMVDKSGIIMTAKHVFDGCKTAQLFHKRKYKIDTVTAIFRPITTSEQLDFDRGVISDIQNVNYGGNLDNFPILNIDLAFGKMTKPFPDFNPLTIREPHKLEILNEVAICGYPAGEHSLDIKGKGLGLRFSPVYQVGRIGGLLPFDDAPEPYGIQTDIIGVGGSSGSPLLDPNDGNVIGIAQRVLPADVEVDVTDFKDLSVKGFGNARIGQIYGLTNHIIHPATIAILQFYKNHKRKHFKVNATGLKFNYNIQVGE